MNVGQRVRKVLDETLNLGGRTASWGDEEALLGTLPELNSLAVVAVLVELEQEFGIVIADDEMEAEVFATLGDLVRFVEHKIK